MDETEFNSVKSEFPEGHIENIQFESLKEIAKQMKNRTNIHSQLQLLKERCFYVDWNTKLKTWENFDDLDSTKQNDLSFYVLHEAKYDLYCTYFAVEQAINSLRKDGLTSAKNLPFPKYDEYRDYQNYESLQKFKELERPYSTKFEHGLQIMKKFIALSTLSTISFEIHRELYQKYLNLIQKQPEEQLFLHLGERQLENSN